MKKVLLFSAVLVFGLLCSCELCAQTAACQPGPACKATCTASKGAAAVKAVGNEQTGAAVFTALAAPGTEAAQPAAKTTQCDPSKCDPTKCDPTKCDPSHCDPSKCDPAKCSGGAHKTRL